MIRLLKSATRFLSKNAPITAIKFRAQCIQIGDLLYSAFLDAKNLFLYREAESWAQSMGVEHQAPEKRRMPNVEWPVFRRGMAPSSIPFAARHGREATEVEFFALVWLSLMGCYCALCEQGIPFLAPPKPILAAMFDYCDLADADVETAYRVFGKDSQEGTVLSRVSRKERNAAPLDEADYAQHRAVFEENGRIRSADYVALNTLLPFH